MYAHPLHAAIVGLVTRCHGNELCQVTSIPPTTTTSVQPKSCHWQLERNLHLQNANKRPNPRQHAIVPASSVSDSNSKPVKTSYGPPNLCAYSRCVDVFKRDTIECANTTWARSEVGCSAVTTSNCDHNTLVQLC